MAILLVRHATAGSRQRWKGDDQLRPLDKRGRRQARKLVSLLGDYPVGRVLSSPYLRCVETVQPLAAGLGVEIVVREELTEGAPVTATLELLREVAVETPVVCTHGDVILGLIGESRETKKGSTWLLEPDDDRFAPAVYLAPPA
jgi:8-oxo-dGTP diphosphatase